MIMSTMYQSSSPRTVSSCYTRTPGRAPPPTLLWHCPSSPPLPLCPLTHQPISPKSQPRAPLPLHSPHYPRPSHNSENSAPAPAPASTRGHGRSRSSPAPARTPAHPSLQPTHHRLEPSPQAPPQAHAAPGPPACPTAPVPAAANTIGCTLLAKSPASARCTSGGA